MDLKITPAEAEMILRHRAKIAHDLAYNEGLRDAYNIVTSTLPMSESRTEVENLIKSLWKEQANAG